MKEQPLKISKELYIKMMGTFYFELHTPPKKKELYEVHIHNFMVDVTNVVMDYFGEEGLAGNMTKREHIYTINYKYPTVLRDELKTKIKRKIKNGTKTIRQLFGI